MWVLAPLRPVNKDAAGAAGDTQQAELQSVPWYLTTGHITLGRPNQKGGTVGKADIIIVGDSSVSSIHAALDIIPGQAAGDHPAVTLTDSSKFGTFHKGQKLEPNHPMPLTDNQDLRFGYKSKFRLLWQPVPLLHVPHPLPDLPAAELDTLLTRSDAATCPWGPQATHCLAAAGQQLTPAVLCAALQGVPVVALSWLQLLVSKTAWRGGLPDVDTHAVDAFVYSCSSGGEQGSDQALQQQVSLSGWAAAGPAGLLQDFCLLADADQPAVLELGALLGAQVYAANSQPPPAANQLYIDCSTPAASRQPPGVAVVPLSLLLACVVERNVQPLQQALQQHAAQAAAAAAAADGSGTELTGDDAGAATDGGDGEDEVVAPLMPAAANSRRMLSASQAAAAAAAAQPTPAASPASGTRGKSRKRTQAAAGAAAAAAAAASPSSKRRKAAVGAGAIGRAPQAAAAGQAAASPVPGLQAPAADTTGRRRAPVATAAAAAATGQAAAGGHGQQGPKSTGIIIADLVMPAAAQQQHPQPQQHQRRVFGQPNQPVVNFKAFRRKGQAPALAHAAAPVGVIDLQVFTANDAHPDTDMFLREEEQRRKRMQKADELFNAAVAPTKSRAAGGGGSSSRQ